MGVLSRFSGLFKSSWEDKYDSQEEAVYETLRENEYTTARELSQHISGMMHSDVKARLSELEDKGFINAPMKRECTVADHSRDVNEYTVAFGFFPPSYGEVAAA